MDMEEGGGGVFFFAYTGLFPVTVWLTGCKKTN